MHSPGFRYLLILVKYLLQGKELKPLPDNTFYYPVKDYVTNENFEEYFKKVKDKPDNYFLDEWLSEEELDALFK